MGKAVRVKNFLEDEDEIDSIDDLEGIGDSEGIDNSDSGVWEEFQGFPEGNESGNGGDDNGWNCPGLGSCTHNSDDGGAPDDLPEPPEGDSDYPPPGEELPDGERIVGPPDFPSDWTFPDPNEAEDAIRRMERHARGGSTTTTSTTTTTTQP